jgi:hypothetical protein
VGSRAFLDAVARRKSPCPCRESKYGHLARSLVTLLTELPHMRACAHVLSNGINKYLCGVLYICE